MIDPVVQTGGYVRRQVARRLAERALAQPARQEHDHSVPVREDDGLVVFGCGCYIADAGPADIIEDDN